MGETQDGIHPKLGTTTLCFCQLQVGHLWALLWGLYGLGLEVTRLWATGIWLWLLAMRYMAIGNWLFASGYGYGYWLWVLVFWL